MTLRGWSQDFPEQIKMADGGHIEFRQIVNIYILNEKNWKFGTQFRIKTQRGADV